MLLKKPSNLFTVLIAAPSLLISFCAGTTGCHNVQNFTQVVDHTGPDGFSSAATFAQQYQLDTSAYRPGGPILFFQGNEAAHMFCVEQLILPKWAKELGAAVATLEHRFFGNSVPSNSTDPKQRFKTLTLDNVMWDSVTFIEWVKISMPEANDSRVIVQGASYGAGLSSWLRLNHPSTFYGALSSAAPLRALGASVDDPAMYNWQSWVLRSISFQSAAAAAKIQNAFVDLERMLTTKAGRAVLQTAFNLCSAPNSTEFGGLLLSFIETTFSHATQFNFGSVQQPVADGSVIVGYPVPSPLAVLMNRIEAIPANDSLRVLNASLSLYMDQFPGCIDFTARVPLFPAIEGSVFSYIGCSYLALSDTAVLPGTIFPPSPANHKVSAALRIHCKQTYNTTILPEAELQKKYHFTQADIQNSTRLLLIQGEFDPTSSVGPKPWDYGPNANASRILYVSDMAHCEDTYAPKKGDRETVVRVSFVERRTL